MLAFYTNTGKAEAQPTEGCHKTRNVPKLL